MSTLDLEKVRRLAAEAWGEWGEEEVGEDGEVILDNGRRIANAREFAIFVGGLKDEEEIAGWLDLEVSELPRKKNEA